MDGWVIYKQIGLELIIGRLDLDRCMDSNKICYINV